MNLSSKSSRPDRGNLRATENSGQLLELKRGEDVNEHTNSLCGHNNLWNLVPTKRVQDEKYILYNYLSEWVTKP